MENNQINLTELSDQDLDDLFGGSATVPYGCCIVLDGC
ncbi:hypothetical protein M2283_009441 [Streptomyces pseudovenezuelae]|uniref:Bacteriocin n=1 Tax=Streptomyces pseudovenezuelae TaxID=67350 RepID=A0ABT6M1Y1_9ACTN|nr:hypothetical protein [Streptomyces pseudovenezuelae]